MSFFQSGVHVHAGNRLASRAGWAELASSDNACTRGTLALCLFVGLFVFVFVFCILCQSTIIAVVRDRGEEERV